LFFVFFVLIAGNDTVPISMWRGKRTHSIERYLVLYDIEKPELLDRI